MKIVTSGILLHILIILLACLKLQAQVLEPGFDAREYAALLGLTYKPKSPEQTKPLDIPFPKDHRHIYRSEIGKLDNCFDIYMRDDGVAVIDIRGTTSRTRSWLENFYAGMLPASGKLQIAENEIFSYKLAEDPGAAVHAGWLTGLATMAPDMVERINELYADGVREIILTGHSQGAAIAYLLRSYLHYDMNDLVPDDIRYKTYHSAAPRPGNLFYAYDYDHINRGGWATRVVSTIDWVPQTPISVQVLEDFSEVNPFKDMATFTNSMGWLQKVVVRSIFRKMDRSLRKAQKRLTKYLGIKMFDFVENYMNGMKEPGYIKSMNYMPAGVAVILIPSEGYYREYAPAVPDDVFRHHRGKAYYYLLRENYSDHF
jgi:hypothetical protein